MLKLINVLIFHGLTTYSPAEMMRPSQHARGAKHTLCVQRCTEKPIHVGAMPDVQTVIHVRHGVNMNWLCRAKGNTLNNGEKSDFG